MGIGSIVTRALTYGKKAIKAAPEFILGTGSEAAGAAMKATKGSIFTKLKAGASAATSAAKGGGFFTRLFKNTVALPGSLFNGIISGAAAAKAAGKSSIVGGTKGFFSSIGKNMPLIGNLVVIGLELPNIFNAGKKEGVGAAIKETGKATARLGGGSVGAMIGGSIGGPIGGAIGFLVGEWLTKKVVGDSYSEKKDYLAQCGIDDKAIEEYKKQGYTTDQIYDSVKEQMEAAEKNMKAIKNLGFSDEESQQLAMAGCTPSQINQLRAQGYSIAQIKEEIAQAQSATPSQYTDSEIALLKQKGATDDDIQQLQSSGFKFEDVIAMIDAQSSSEPQQTQVATPTQSLETVAPQVQTAQVATTNPVINEVENFNLPYQNIYGTQTQLSNAGLQPSMFATNPMTSLYGNNYGNDIYYQSLFGSTQGTSPDYLKAQYRPFGYTA